MLISVGFLKSNVSLDVTSIIIYLILKVLVFESCIHFLCNNAFFLFLPGIVYALRTEKGGDLYRKVVKTMLSYGVFLRVMKNGRIILSRRNFGKFMANSFLISKVPC